LACFISLSFNTAQSQCTAAFTDSVSGFTAYFTSQASGSFNYLGYTFGDATFVNQVPNPIHSYAQPGFYIACQTVLDTNSPNCYDNTCDTLNIGNLLCQADYVFSPSGLSVEFTAQAFGAYDSLLWSFGDGTFSNVLNPIHIYNSAGAYNTCLSLYVGGALCSQICYQAVVDSVACVSDFNTVANGLTVNFINTSTGGFDAQYWDFGDGFGNSVLNSPSYTYFTPGTYTVCMTIFDTIFGSCVDNVCIDVIVTAGGGGACDADFEYTTDQLNIECTDLSSGLILTAFWDFGDGSTPGINPNHTYAQPGTYEVCLTVGNIFPFCFDTYCESVTVNEFTCEPAFEFTRDANNLYSFSNTTSVGNVTSVLWEFGDGNTSTFASPTYTYNAPGTYEVCLTTYDGENACGVVCQDVNVFPLGLSDVKSRSFSIYPNPSDGSFELSNASASGNLEITLYDLSGRVIANRAVSNASTMVSLNYDVPAGIYMMDVDADNGAGETFRLIITQ